MARISDDYWQPIDAQNFVAWKKVYVKTKFLIHMCDEYNRQQELEMIKMKAASEAASSAKANATPQSRDKQVKSLIYNTHLSRLPTVI